MTAQYNQKNPYLFNQNLYQQKQTSEQFLEINKRIDLDSQGHKIMDSIMEWFQNKGIKEGIPQFIQQTYEARCKQQTLSKLQTPQREDSPLKKRRNISLNLKLNLNKNGFSIDLAN